MRIVIGIIRTMEVIRYGETTTRDMARMDCNIEWRQVWEVPLRIQVAPYHIVGIRNQNVRQTMRLSLKHTISTGLLCAMVICSTGCNSRNSLENVTLSDTAATQMESIPAASEVSGKVDAKDFPLSENAEGIPVMTGTLSSGVQINARIYCERDIHSPGSGSIDTANLRSFTPEDLSKIQQDSWSITSDFTQEMGTDGNIWDYRTIEYMDLHGQKASACNLDYGVIFGSVELAAPDRVPWFSEDFAWQTEDFSFMTGEEAFVDFRQLAANCGVDLSSVYKIDRVTFEAFETYYRVQISFGADLREKTWSREDDAYYLTASQDWNSLPIVSDTLYMMYNGTDLQGSEYHTVTNNCLTSIVSSDGIRELELQNVFELQTKGKDNALISLWDALESIKKYIDQPQYESEILYGMSSNSERNMTIDQVELCYVPVWQGTPGVESDMLYDMIPCWTFRVIGDNKSSGLQVYTAVVNAVTGEYMYQTNMIESI